MTSTFPTSKSSSYDLKYGIRQIQSKKETLRNLETALKKRISEFKELCMKEGELTGHLPVDYPLQPREPIPQVRRRIARSNGNIACDSVVSSVAPPYPIRPARQRASNFAIPNNPGTNVPFPSRPTSTNSTCSSASTASSTTRVINQAQNSVVGSSGSSTRSISNDGVANLQQPYYEETKPFQMSDFYKYSSKHRLKVNCNASHMIQSHDSKSKTTRQHQEEISKMKDSLKFASCDDQIQASVNLIERSGHKLIEATAKAIAGNPGLAEKLNNYLPNHGHRY